MKDYQKTMSHNPDNPAFSLLFHIADALSDGVVIVDSTATVVYVNGNLTDILGYTNAELIGGTLDVLVPPYFRESHHFDVQRFLDHPFSRPMGLGLEIPGYHRDGYSVPLEISLSHIVLEGQTFVMASLVDIRPRKELEQSLRHADRLRQELNRERELKALQNHFMSLLTRELRTPLSVIQVSADTLKGHYEALSEERRRACFRSIDEQVSRLTDMLSEVAKISTLQEDALDFQPQRINFSHYVNEIAETFQQRFNQTVRLNFSFEIEDEEVFLDYGLIYYVISELITNAVKFSPQGGGIELRASSQGSYLAIEVSDSGIGIPADEAEHIFQPFYRATNVGRIAGNGLGLTIVKNYVGLHNGTIRVYSDINQGTTVRIELPIVGQPSGERMNP